MRSSEHGALSWSSTPSRYDEIQSSKSIYALCKLERAKQIGSASRDSREGLIELSSDSDSDLDIVTEVDECIFRDAVTRKRKRRTSSYKHNCRAALSTTLSITKARHKSTDDVQEQKSSKDVKTLKLVGTDSKYPKQPPNVKIKINNNAFSLRHTALASPLHEITPDGIEDIYASQQLNDILTRATCVAKEFETHDPYAETQELQALVRTSCQTTVFEQEPGVFPNDPTAEKRIVKKLKLPKELPFVSRTNHLPSLLENILPGTVGSEQCLHTDFSYLSVLKIAECLQNEEEIREPVELSEHLSTYLLRRSAKGVHDFINEHDLWKSSARKDELRKLCSKPKSIYVNCLDQRDWLHQHQSISYRADAIIARELGFPASVRRGGKHVRDAVLPGLLKAAKIFRGTSGDVNAIDFSPSGDSAIVGSIATDDEFNRSGNLIMLKGDEHHDMSHCHVLDAKNRARQRYPTISCVRFVRNGSFFLAGGADETLKVYSASGRFLHDKSRKNRACTHDIVTSLRHPSIAFTCHGSGHLDVHTFREDGVSGTYSLHYHDTLEPATAVYQDGLDQLLVGYQAKSPKSIAGQASIIDATKMTVLRSFRGEEAYAHICAGENGLWAAGTNPRFSGLVKIFDARCEDAVVKSFRNQQTDINEVAMCEHYITSAATDGTCYVWDIRKSSSYEPLHVLRHGKPIHTTDSDDVCGITGSLFFNSSRFVTGGSDGVVKLWDLGVSEPWIKDMAQVVSPITRMALSHERDQMMIGENRGDVHLWSIKGNGEQEQLIEEPL